MLVEPWQRASSRIGYVILDEPPSPICYKQWCARELVVNLSATIFVFIILMTENHLEFPTSSVCLIRSSMGWECGSPASAWEASLPWSGCPSTAFFVAGPPAMTPHKWAAWQRQPTLVNRTLCHALRRTAIMFNILDSIWYRKAKLTTQPSKMQG